MSTVGVNLILVICVALRGIEVLENSLIFYKLLKIVHTVIVPNLVQRPLHALHVQSQFALKLLSDKLILYSLLSLSLSV